MDSSWHFQRLDASHAGELHALEKICFALPWSEEQYAAMFRQRHFAAFGLMRESRLCAYISLLITGDESEILNFAVLPRLRRCGVGGRLLRMVLRMFAKMGMQRTALEVRVGNAPARALYERCGFVPAGRRPKYYADTGEDAIIYALSPITTPEQDRKEP